MDEANLLKPFNHEPRTRLIFGPGCVDRVGQLVRQLQGRCALVVTDAGIVAAGHARRAIRAIEQAGAAVTVFDEVHENPTTADVQACLKVAAAAAIDTIVGLGGGSSLDTAKGCNFLLTNGGRMQDYQGRGKATSPMLPLVAVPTTAGTGSECQSFALIADQDTGQKMACGDPKAAARIALLDPQLTLTQPSQVTACTGIDTVAHALETAVTRPRNALSLLYSHEAFRLAHDALPQVLEKPGNLDARSRMQLAATYAGIAIENSMLGAAHSAANPLTARYGVVHGQAVGIMLPPVMRFNGQDGPAAATYRQLARRCDLCDGQADGPAALEALVRGVESLLDRAGLRSCLFNLKIPRSAMAKLAAEAARQWTAQFNPRSVSSADFYDLYERVYSPAP